MSLSVAGYCEVQVELPAPRHQAQAVRVTVDSGDKDVNITLVEEKNTSNSDEENTKVVNSEYISNSLNPLYKINASQTVED